MKRNQMGNLINKKQISGQWDLLESARQIMGHWGMESRDIQLVQHRENIVYKVSTTDGYPYALRIHRADYHTDASLNSELVWMKALDEYGIDVPRIIPALSGDNFTHITFPETGKIHQVDLLQWINGSPLGRIEDGLKNDSAWIGRTYTEIGKIAARLHNQASSWVIPKNFTRHAWDMEGLAGKTPLWGKFWNVDLMTSEQSGLIHRGIRKACQDLSRYGQHPDEYSMIHADLLPENILLEEDRVRIIDFDDSGFGWHLFDLATTLYFLQEDPFYNIAFDALVAGYRSYRSLSDEQLSRLPLFLALRGFTYLGWLQTRNRLKEDVEHGIDEIHRTCTAVEKYLNTP